MTTRARRPRVTSALIPVVCAPCVLVGSMLSPSPAYAARQVLFRDLRTLVAEDVREENGLAILDMGHGNQIRVPAEAVVEVRDYTPPPPPPPEPGVADAAVETPEIVGPPVPTWRQRAGLFADHVEKTARQHRIDPALLVAVAVQESRFQRFALSRKGAQGVMQLMPSTARLLKIDDVWDAQKNIDAGARWLRRLLDRFDGDVDLALAAYNAGEEAVKRCGGIPPYTETRDYVRQVRAMVRAFVDAQAAPSRER